MDSPKLLPTIQFKDVESMNDSWKSSSDAVRQALEMYGCFVIEYEEMKPDLREEMFRLSEELFGVPLETKRKTASKVLGSGYGGNFSDMPHFEYFGIQHEAADLQSKKDFTTLIWPQGNDHFCETLESCCEMVLGLERMVMKMVISSYGSELEKYYEPLMASSFYLTRLMRYAAAAEGENNTDIGLLPHRDKNFLSVIGTNHVPGLEIQTRDGDWISFQPSPRRFVVFVGEALMAWSNGRLYCPLHQVVTTGTQEKYSIGLFSFIRGDIAVPEDLVDDEHPLKFKPFNHGHFLDYCKKGGPTMMGAIHTFCGIQH